MALQDWTIATSLSNDPFPTNQYKILDYTAGATGEGNLSNSSSQVSITYLVNYEALGLFTDALLGTTTVQSSMLSRIVPEEHPDFQSYFANRLDFKPMGIPAQVGRSPTWNKSAVTCVFQPNPFVILPDAKTTSELQRFCIKNLTTKVDYLNTGVGTFYFVNGATPKVPLAASPGFLVPSQILEITWLKIPTGRYYLDYSPMDTYAKANLGKLNTTTFELWTVPGSVLFMDYKTERVLPSSQFGNYYWDITYTFGIRDNLASMGQGGWNYYWNNVDQAYQLVTTDGTATGGKVYPQSFDLNQLFNVANFN